MGAEWAVMHPIKHPRHKPYGRGATGAARESRLRTDESRLYFGSGEHFAEHETVVQLAREHFADLPSEMPERFVPGVYTGGEFREVRAGRAQ